MKVLKLNIYFATFYSYSTSLDGFLGMDRRGAIVYGQGHLSVCVHV